MVITPSEFLKTAVSAARHAGDIIMKNLGQLSKADIAAGSLLISEAGGLVTGFDGAGEFLSTGNVVAGNKALHPVLLKTIKQVFTQESRGN